MEYFKKLQVQENIQQYIDSPVRICEIAILQDSVDKDILGRIKFLNQSDKKIIAIFINLITYDISGDQIDFPEDKFIYQDMLIEPGEIYGNKIAIDLPTNARRLDITLRKVVFEDGQIWNFQNELICGGIEQKEIEPIDKNFDRVQNVLSERILNLEYVKYYYSENNKAWKCTCGKLNSLDNEYCSFCKNDRKSQKELLSVLGLNKLCDEINREVEIEEAEKKRILEEKNKLIQEENNRQNALAEKERTENEKKAKMKKKRNIIICIIIGVISTIIIGKWVYENVVIPSNKYDQAVELLSEQKYKEAISMFEELDDYKDSLSQIDYANEKINEQIKEEAYQKAINLMDEEKYKEAIEVWNQILDYKDAQIECNIAKEKFEEAEQEFLYQQGMAYLEDNDYDNAKKAFQECFSYGVFKDTKEQIDRIDAYEKKIQLTLDNVEKASEMLGMYSETDNITLEQDMYEFITNEISIFGHKGYFTHGYTRDATEDRIYINKMTWESSKSIFNNDEKFNVLINDLVYVYGANKMVAVYKNHPNTHIWTDVKGYKSVCCWRNDDKVFICWNID